jgi:hypothetical protein
MHDHVSGGIGEKVGSAGCGLASTDLLLMLRLNAAMIGESDQVNGNAPPYRTQSFGQKLSQKLVEVILKIIEVSQLASQFSQDSGSSGRPFKVLAGLADGDTKGGSKDQHVEEINHLDIVSTSFQGEMAEELYSKFVYMAGVQAIMKFISHEDSPFYWVGVFSQLSESPSFFTGSRVHRAFFNY